MFTLRIRGVGRRRVIAIVALTAPVALGLAVLMSINTESSRTPTTSEGNATTPPAQGAAAGIPFGPSKLPSDLFGGLFTGTKLAVSPDSIISDLKEARAGAMRVIIILVGSQRYYRNPEGTFDLDAWRARVDRFRGIDLSEFIEDGTIVAHQLVSEAKARKQWGGAIIPNDVLDEMARHSKEIWPNMATVLRTDPSDLEEHGAGYRAAWPGWKWEYLDAASARYLARKGHVAEFAANEQASANRQSLALVVGLNVLSGGDGSSGIASPAAGKWAMSADELRLYGSTMLSQTTACEFEMWRYETPGSDYEDLGYFRRADITAALVELAAVAARHPARSCGTSTRRALP